MIKEMGRRACLRIKKLGDIYLGIYTSFYAFFEKTILDSVNIVCMFKYNLKLYLSFQLCP